MKYLITILLLLGSLAGQAQELQLPSLELKTADDYARYTADVIRAVDWLESQPVTDARREEVERFVFTWASGSPTVSVEIKPETVGFMDEHQLLLLYIGAWTRAALQQPQASKLDYTRQSLEVVMQFYQAHKKALGRNKAVEKLLKMQQKGSLEAYLRENV